MGGFELHNFQKREEADSANSESSGAPRSARTSFVRGGDPLRDRLGFAPLLS